MSEHRRDTWLSAEGVFLTETTEMEAAGEFFAGRTFVRHHPIEDCAGRHCCIHNPSDHHMTTWPLVWREDRQYMERRCPHNTGHPDPDSLRWNREFRNRDMGVHGCDGCCQPTSKE